MVVSWYFTMVERNKSPSTNIADPRVTWTNPRPVNGQSSLRLKFYLDEHGSHFASWNSRGIRLDLPNVIYGFVAKFPSQNLGPKHYNKQKSLLAAYIYCDGPQTSSWRLVFIQLNGP